MSRPPRGRLLVIVSAAAIAIATLVPTGPGGSSAGFCILCGHRGLSDFISNILLFAPLGFALALRGVPLFRIAALGAMSSLVIELAQFDLISGRDANVGDLLANGVGAAVGGLIGHHRHWWLDPEARTRWLAMTAGTLALLLACLMMFIPSLPQSTYHMQWTARFGNMGIYNGNVLWSRIGDLDIPGGRSIEQTDSVRRLLFREPLEFLATADRGADMAPIVSIYDDEQLEIMMLGAQRADLFYRYRMLADELRLDHGDIRVHHAFEHIQDERTFRLRWSINRREYCLDVNGHSQCGRGFTVGDTWTLLMALDWGTDERRVLGAVWLWLMFVPAGLLAARPHTLLAAGALVALVLPAVPLFAGFAITPLYQILAGLAGLITGSLLSRRAHVSMRSNVADIGRNS